MKRKMKLNLVDEEMEKWLLSRDWIFHYSGNGNGLWAMFSPFDEADWEEEGNHKIELCPDTNFPLTGNSFNTVHLWRESQATYSFPFVHLKIIQSDILDSRIKDVEVHFAHRRTGGNYEQVFRGFVDSLEELKTVFALLGVEQKQLD